MKRIILFLFLMISNVVLAQDVVVNVSVSANQVSLKDALQLTLTISGAKDNIAPVELPKIDGLESRYLGPSTKISIVNGQYSNEKSFIYNLFPTKTGHVQVPALKINVAGQDYATQPIDIEIMPTSDASSNSTQGQELTQENIKDRIFLTVSVPEQQVYLGQKIPVTIKFFVSQLPVRNIQYPRIDQNGFVIEGMAAPVQYSQVQNGIKYDVVEFNAFIYPTRTGDLAIGPVQLEGNLLYKAQTANNSFFNDDFFNGLFENYQSRPLTVNSAPLKINVLDLPLEGKPANFSGAVGQLNFEASVGPLEVKVGDPITLRMKIQGSANFKSLQMPIFNDARFKTYDPQVKDGANERSLEQVIIPTTDQIQEVPAIALNYFDPVAREYKVIIQGPFAIKITPSLPSEEFKAIGFSNLPQNGVTVAPIDYVQKYIQAPIIAGIKFAKTWQFWTGILCLGLLGLAGVMWLRFNQRLNQDSLFARRVRAFKQAKVGMSEASKYLKDGKGQEFYNSIFKTLNQYLSDKLNQPLGALSWDKLLPLLKQKNIDPTNINIIKEIFDTCDMVRFASHTTDATRMPQDLTKLQSLITYFEKNLK